MILKSMLSKHGLLVIYSEFLIAIANVYARGDSESGLDTFLRTLSVMIVSQHSYISLKYFQYATLT